MDVTFLGTGSAMPIPDRVQTGLLIEKADTSMLLDCGSGVLHRLVNTNRGYEDIETVLLTHHHIDHISDLLPLLKARWLVGKPSLRIVGPTGTESLIKNLLEVHEYLQDRLELQFQELDAGNYHIGPFEIASKETRHSMHCLAYKIDNKFTFSADTEAFEELIEFAADSQVLVHDCSFPDEIDVSNHPTPEKLGAVLSGHSFEQVYLTHLYPHTEGKHNEMLESINEQYSGEVRFARDGRTISIPDR